MSLLQCSLFRIIKALFFAIQCRRVFHSLPFVPSAVSAILFKYDTVIALSLALSLAKPNWINIQSHKYVNLSLIFSLHISRKYFRYNRRSFHVFTRTEWIHFAYSLACVHIETSSFQQNPMQLENIHSFWVYLRSVASIFCGVVCRRNDRILFMMMFFSRFRSVHHRATWSTMMEAMEPTWLTYQSRYVLRYLRLLGCIRTKTHGCSARNKIKRNFAKFTLFFFLLPPFSYISFLLQCYQMCVPENECDMLSLANKITQKMSLCCIQSVQISKPYSGWWLFEIASICFSFSIDIGLI